MVVGELNFRQIHRRIDWGKQAKTIDNVSQIDVKKETRAKKIQFYQIHFALQIDTKTIAGMRTITGIQEKG